MNIDLFKTMLRADEIDLKQALTDLLKKKYTEVYEDEMFVVAVGTDPVALCAHLDTVPLQPKEDEIIYDEICNVITADNGLGADDRAGVYAIVDVICKTEYRPTVIFTLGEESGGKGAKALIEKYPQPFDNYKFIIQLDRKGYNDCVFYDCDNEDFIDFIESYGFVEQWGSFTDISYIAPAWGIAAVNLSVGYYDEHTAEEHFYPAVLDRTIGIVIKILEDVCDEKIIVPSFIYIPRPTTARCTYCVRKVPYSNVIQLDDPITGQYMNVCLDCYKKIYM